MKLRVQHKTEIFEFPIELQDTAQLSRVLSALWNNGLMALPEESRMTPEKMSNDLHAIFSDENLKNEGALSEADFTWEDDIHGFPFTLIFDGVRDLEDNYIPEIVTLNTLGYDKSYSFDGRWYSRKGHSPFNFLQNLDIQNPEAQLEAQKAQLDEQNRKRSEKKDQKKAYKEQRAHSQVSSGETPDVQVSPSLDSTDFPFQKTNDKQDSEVINMQQGPNLNDESDEFDEVDLGSHSPEEQNEFGSVVPVLDRQSSEEQLQEVATQHNAKTTSKSSLVSAPVNAAKWGYTQAASGASWATTKATDGAFWAKTKATDGASWAKAKTQQGVHKLRSIDRNSFNNFAPYAAVAGASFVARQWIISAFAAATSIVLSPLMVVAGALGFSFAVDKGRQRLKAWEASNYAKKSEKALDELNLGQCNAFMMGVEAQETYKGQITACFKWDAIRHGHAYYAGMGAKQSNNQDLIKELKQKGVQALSQQLN